MGWVGILLGPMKVPTCLMPSRYLLADTLRGESTCWQGTRCCICFCLLLVQGPLGSTCSSGGVGVAQGMVHWTKVPLNFTGLLLSEMTYCVTGGYFSRKALGSTAGISQRYRIVFSLNPNSKSLGCELGFECWAGWSHGLLKSASIHPRFKGSQKSRKFNCSKHLEGSHICVTDSLCCTAETNTTL